MVATFKITVDVSQLAKLIPWSAALKSKSVASLQQAFNGALPAITSTERMRTGNMRRSTTMATNAEGATITALAGYSGFQNFGTRYMSGTHFMEAGVQSIMSALPSAMQSAIAI
jgi:microsomal dipeptidase-like Zn-dependent dipeptidase